MTLPNQERTDAASLVGRLRIKAGMLRMGEPVAFGSDADVMDEAADEITRLRALLEKAKDGLEPMREEADEWTDGASDNMCVGICLRDLRRARALHDEINEAISK